MKMTENPPMRPQRQMVRTNRETTGGLLMSVIRTLNQSRDLADRDRERAELRNGFNECDQKLNELIASHSNDLYQVMNTFSRVLNNLSKAKERVLSTREKLMNCQKLLHCKRNELNQLWIELVENRAQLAILEKVEYVVSLPKSIDEAISQKHYVHASQSCMEGLNLLTDPNEASSGSNSNTGIVPADNQASGFLSKIEALSEIRTELSRKKEALFENAIDDLHRDLYQLSSAEIRKEFLRQNRASEENNQLVLSVEIGSKNGSLTNSSGSGESHSTTLRLSNENEETEIINTKAGQENLIGLTKCLVILNKVPDSMEQFRERCERELITIAIKTAQEILNTYSNVLHTNSGTGNDDASSKWNLFNGTAPVSDFEQNSRFSESLGFSGIGKQNNRVAVLSFAPLLGLNYDAYSHLPIMPTSNSNKSIEKTRSQQSATMLKNFFSLLMSEFQRILVLHRDIVLQNFERLEASLYSKMTQEDFYSVEELWAKIQKLVVDLVACISADTGRGCFPLLDNTLAGARIDASNSAAQGGSTVAGSAALNGDLSSYFAKRRPLAGAMNAMNVVTKNTMTAVASAAASATSGATAASANLNASSEGQSNSNISGTGINNSGQSNTGNSGTTGGMVSSSSTHNFLSSVVGGSSQKQNAAPLFKFSQSLPAISWSAYLAEQAKEKEKEQEEINIDKRKDQDMELSKDDQGRIIPGSTGSSSSGVSSSMINKLFDALREIAPPCLDNLVIIFGILLQHCNQGKSKKNFLREHLVELAEKFCQQVQDQVARVVELSYKRLQDRSTLRLFPLRSAYFENKLIEEAERSKLCKDESFQLMQQQQQLNSRLYPPLLTSVVIGDITARELESLMNAMPEYRESYLACICELFTELKSQFNDAYQKATLNTFGDQTHELSSVSWANDLDIVRTFKELPNWQSMIEKQSLCYEYPLEINDKTQDNKDKNNSGPKMSSAEARRQYNLHAQLSSFDDSPEEIRLRNQRETDILAQNILEKKSNKMECSPVFGSGDVHQFEHLAQLHESADWMTARCEDVVERIYDRFKDFPDFLDGVNIATLNNLVNEFREFSEKCLILIHLEVRFHCFYHLRDLDQSFFTNQAPILKSESGDGKNGKGSDRSTSRRYDAMHEDRLINPLLDDLKRIHEELEKASLKPQKMLYVFEGLDSLIKTIFIHSVSKVNRIKSNGIKRALRAIFNIQKRLMGITKNRESRLDYCRKYFETLLLTPEEVLQRIIEIGQEFDRSEYKTAIILLHNSKRAEQEILTGSGGASVHTAAATNLSQAELNRYLTQADELLSKVSLNL